MTHHHHRDPPHEGRSTTCRAHLVTPTMAKRPPHLCIRRPFSPLLAHHLTLIPPSDDTPPENLPPPASLFLLNPPHARSSPARDGSNVQSLKKKASLKMTPPNRAFLVAATSSSSFSASSSSSPSFPSSCGVLVGLRSLRSLSRASHWRVSTSKLGQTLQECQQTWLP